MRHRMLPCVLVVMLASMTFAQQPAKKGGKGGAGARAVPEGARVVRDMEYAKAGEKSLKLDLYLPKASAERPPLVVWIHGGAWRAGSKENMPLGWLLEHGYALASINYRLSQEATFPAQIQDSKAAIRWLRAHAAEYGYNADRIGVSGASAGGHLVAMLGTAGGVKELEGEVGGNLDRSSDVQAVVNFFGPTNLISMCSQPSRMNHAAPDSPESRLIGGAVLEHKDKAAAASPVTYVTANDPPFMTIHGDEDPLVPVQQGQELHAALKAAGVKSHMDIIEGGGHGGAGFHDDPARRERIRAFLDEHLKGK